MKQSPAVLALIFLTALSFPENAIGQSKQPALDKKLTSVLPASISAALCRYYVFPDKAKLMSDFIQSQSSKGKYDLIHNPTELANQLSSDIRSVHYDHHIRIVYDPQLEKDIVEFSSKKGTTNVPEADMSDDEKRNFYFKKLEILPANIGFIEFNGFASSSTSSGKTIHAAMQFVAHTDALIIDLRNNFGGSGSTEIVSYFFNTRTYTGRSFNRIENKWTDQYIENKKTVTNGLILNMPVYILTSSRTFSAAEGFAYTLQNMRNAVVIGDTTRGGAHLTRSFSLGNGFVGFIPYLRGENVVTKTDWEGTGVIPNVAIEEDNCLLATQNIILEKKSASATSGTEKAKINYIINYNKSKTASVVIEPSKASKCTGRFAEYEVILQGNQLMFRDTNQPAINYKKMTAITTRLFQVGNDYQVEFVIENDLCNSIRMYWDDGFEDKISKTQE